MPYVKQEVREVFDRHAELIATNWYSLFDRDPGVLNYVISKIIAESIRLSDRGIGGDPNDYEFYNSVLGALSAAKLELYRRLVADYEDGKMQTNGDVYV